MTKISRRAFLQVLALGAGTAAAGQLLTACGSAASIKTKLPANTPPPGTPDLAVARGGNVPEQLVRRAVAALGGIERFVARGSSVVIKPNICTAGRSYEYAATTNPWVVAALVTMCREAGASRVTVLDYPIGGTSLQAYISSGIQEQVLAAGGEMQEISMVKFLPVIIPAAVQLKECKIYDEVLNADTLINVPIPKQHSLARITIGMKNLLGVISDRPSCHTGLADKLADLAGYLRPALTVVDAVRILTANGPTGGNLGDVQELDMVIAGTDFVAADCYAASLFGLDGANDLAYVKAASQRGLGRTDLSNLKIEEIPIGA